MSATYKCAFLPFLISPLCYGPEMTESLSSSRCHYRRSSCPLAFDLLPPALWRWLIERQPEETRLSALRDVIVGPIELIVRAAELQDIAVWVDDVQIPYAPRALIGRSFCFDAERFQLGVELVQVLGAHLDVEAALHLGNPS